jgi:hypothetical protein
MGATTDQDSLALLLAASRQFRLGAYADVIATLENDSTGGGEVGRAMSLTARAMLLAEDGRSAEAAPLMEQALGLMVPVPEVLEAIAAFFASTGEPRLSHYAFLLADMYQPRSLARFEAALADPDRVRYAPWAMRRSDAARREDLYELGSRKAGLRERLGPGGAAMVLASMTGSPGSHRAGRRPHVRLIDFAREHGREFELVTEARRVRYGSPNLLGRARGPSVDRTTRPFFTCVLENVIVSAKSDTLLAADVAISDAMDDATQTRVFDVDPILAGGEADTVFVAEPAEPDLLRHVPEALWLSGIDSRAFGHWIIEYLPRVWAFMDRPAFGGLPVIIDEGMPPQIEEALRFFIGPANPLIKMARGERLRVDALWVASRIFERETVDVDGLLPLLERARPAIERVDTAGAPERIYLSRKPTQHRRLENSRAIEDLARRHGFEVFDFGDLRFVEQVRLIRGAKHVLGPDGSATLMTFLAGPGLRISKLSQPFIEEVEGYAHVSEALRQDLTVIVGDLETEHPRYPWMSDYSIDTDALASYLEGVADGVSSSPV